MGGPAGENIDRLTRAYRRLLWAYPRYYRRVRGTEMLTTLLDAAAPGQRRPSRRDVVDLLGGGLRCRLRVPPGPSYRLVALGVALVVAGAGAWLGTLAGWHMSPSLPTEAEVIAAATVAVPDAAQRLPARRKHCDRSCWPNPSDDLIVYDDPFQSDDTMPSLSDPDRPRDTAPSTNRVYLPLTMPHEEMRDIAVRAHDRLAAAGWRVSPVRTHYDMRLFWATKGELTLRFEGRGNTMPDYPAVAIIVHHDAPPAALPAAVAGFVVGLVIGWWLAAFAVRRYLLQYRTIRTAMLVTGLPTLAVTVLPVASGLIAAVIAGRAGGAGTAQATLLGTAFVYLYSPLVVVIVGSMLSSLALAMTPVPATGRSPGPTVTPA
jgi:hypothetical protein